MGRWGKLERLDGRSSIRGFGGERLHFSYLQICITYGTLTVGRLDERSRKRGFVGQRPLFFRYLQIYTTYGTLTFNQSLIISVCYFQTTYYIHLIYVH